QLDETGEYPHRIALPSLSMQTKPQQKQNVGFIGGLFQRGTAAVFRGDQIARLQVSHNGGNQDVIGHLAHVSGTESSGSSIPCASLNPQLPVVCSELQSERERHAIPASPAHRVDVVLSAESAARAAGRCLQ